MTISRDFDSIGNKHKELEAIYDYRLVPGSLIMARLDGRAFHSLLKKADKPYDLSYITALEATTIAVIKEFAVDLAYVQSDEITLFWHNLNMFDLRVQKLCSVLASFTCSNFSQRWDLKCIMPSFDCRIWQEPTLEGVAENLLWREWDASKNSVSMAAHTMFKQKELHGKSTKERIEMMESKGFHWNQLDDRLKRGSFFKRVKVLSTLTEEEYAKVPAKHQHLHQGPVERSVIERKNWPRLTQIKNLVSILSEDVDIEL